MIRAAAKNHGSVAVVTDPRQYRPCSTSCGPAGGALSDATRVAPGAGGLPPDRAVRRGHRRLPALAGRHAGVAERVPTSFRIRCGSRPSASRTLRYGENPHQTAAFYRIAGAPPVGLAGMKQLHGPELGYNNLLDFSAALGLLLEFDEPAAVVIKHTNPCGAALGPTVGEAMARAKACDPVSIYGGIVGVNRTLDMAVVQALAGIFVEILFAPAFAARRAGGAARAPRRSAASSRCRATARACRPGWRSTAACSAASSCSRPTWPTSTPARSRR